jgi:acetyl esterase/lipase
MLRYEPDAHFEVRDFDVEYRHDGARGWLAHVWQPQGPGPFPALIEIHGGAWGQFDRLRDAMIIAPIAAAGMVVVAVDFHLSTEAPYPAAQADIHYATRWLKANAQRYRASPDALGGLGISSGGHQLLLNAMRPHDPRYAALPLASAADASLAYLILGWVPLDPWNRYTEARARGDRVLFDATIRYFRDEATLREANPQLVLERGEPVELPPALLLQGSEDENVNPFVAERFVEAYARAGGCIEFAKYPRAKHAFMRVPGAHTERALALMKSFIARQLADRAVPGAV